MKKRILSILLCLCMVLMLCPVTAFAEGETCTVTFDMNGREGNGTSPAPLTMPKGSKIQAPTSPSADEVFDGYNFLYWYYKNEDNQTVKWNFDEDTVQSDLTLYAEWVDYPVVNIKVTLDGEPYPGLALEYRSKTDEDLVYKFTETSTGGTYQYNGVRPGSYKVYVNNEYFSTDSFYPGVIESNESMKFYNVTFDANGQEFTEETAPASQLCWFFALKSDNSVERPADPVAKDPNYQFIGWTVGPEPDSGEFDFVTASIHSKTVIYAQWDRIADENTFPVTAERATIIGSSYAKRGEDYHATLVPVDGYELPFKFISSSPICTHIKIGGEMLNKNNYTLNLQTGELTIPGKYITGRVEIVTFPRQNPFIIHFNANGGTGTQEGEGAKVYDQQNGYDYASSDGGRPMGYYYLPSCTMTPPDGKMFSRWSLSSDGSYNNYDPGKCYWTYRDTTFYAVWKDAPKGTYTVAYNLTDCKFSGSTNASNGSDYTTVITPKGGYAATITLDSVQVGGNTLDSSEYLTIQDSKTGALTLTVPGDKITGNMIITASAEPIYTVSFNTDGGTIIPSKTTVRWADTVLDGVSDPTKDGWRFTGWKYGDEIVTPETTYKDLAADSTVLSIELKAQWEDITAPTGKITIGTNSWKAFLNKITFGLFFKDTKTVTITASDNSGEAVTISYLLSDKALTADDLAGKEFIAYTGGFDIEPNNEWIIYVMLTDEAGNVTYLSSDGIVLDNVAPVISGVKNGKTYCGAQTVTVDEKYIDSVTVNGKEVTLQNNQFTLPAAEGTQKILATDKAGNVSAEITVTVNDGHTAGNDDGNCSTPVYCIYHPDTVVVAAKSHDFSGEWQKNGTDHWHICQNDGCTVAETETPHSGTDDGDCTTAVICECGYVITAANAEHSYGECQSNGDGTHTRYCTVDGCSGYEDGNCAGGEATCVAKAVCDTCKAEYGESDSANHNLEKIPAKDATVTETGNTEYWHCQDCGKYFADENGTKEIKLDETVTAKLPPEMIDGMRQSVTEGEKKELTFRSNAAYSDFIRAQLDGKTLDEKYYNVKEGSTVVTLKADYVATLSAGEHTIGIVSESGTATTTFIVNAKAVVDNDTKSPQTGDNSHMALWIALLFVSGAGVIGTTVYGKKKRAK